MIKKKFIIFLVFTSFLFCIFHDFAGADSPCNEKGTASWQNKRLAFIKDAIRLKIIMKVEEHGKMVFCYVDNRFYSLTYDHKQSFVDAVLSYYYCKPPNADTMILYDGYNGKKIGSFSAKYGLQMD